MLKHGILGLLNYGDMTGYEIMEVFRDSLNFFWKAQTSQIYRELQLLKNKGFVDDRLVEQIGKPDKKIFAITESGKQELYRWLLEDATGLDTKSSVLMRVFFRGEMPVKENLKYFKRLKQECINFLEGLQQANGYAEGYGEQIDSKYKSLYWKMTVDYGYRYIQMVISWCDDCIKEMEELNEHISD